MQRLSNAGTPHFALGGQSGQFNHNHASMMGHAAALRLQAARALSGRPDVAAARPAGGPSGVPPSGPSMAPQAPSMNYKAQIAGVAANHGFQVGVPHIHAAIDSMASKGKITPFQANALKAHNGPLVGPQGQATQAGIMSEMLSRGGA